jgi:hypothetical protein
MSAMFYFETLLPNWSDDRFRSTRQPSHPIAVSHILTHTHEPAAIA